MNSLPFVWTKVGNWINVQMFDAAKMYHLDILKMVRFTSSYDNADAQKDAVDASIHVPCFCMLWNFRNIYFALM